jgi:hypothetical protein
MTKPILTVPVVQSWWGEVEANVPLIDWRVLGRGLGWCLLAASRLRFELPRPDHRERLHSNVSMVLIVDRYLQPAGEQPPLKAL